MRCAHVRRVKKLFTNIQKQQNMSKISLLFKKFTNFTDKYLENSWDSECQIFRVLVLYEHKHIGRFSNLHWYTFKLDFIWKIYMTRLLMILVMDFFFFFFDSKSYCEVAVLFLLNLLFNTNQPFYYKIQRDKFRLNYWYLNCS